MKKYNNDYSLYFYEGIIVSK